ncbi:MAG: TonB-dependent receptor, partial [Alistipes sp.]|nr:TonB-dependent receptor [Alistipes sp.]
MKKLLLSMLSLFAASAVCAQVTTSGMNGAITDQAGDPLVGATVIAEHTPSGTQYGAVTDIDGHYNLQGLRPGGPYTVTVSFVGYQSVVFPGLMLSLGESLKRDAYLRDNQEIEVVVVRGDGANSSMNINRAGAITSISNEQIEMLPSVSRSMNDIMKLTPQASSTTSGLAIGGGNYRQSYVTVDGASFNNMFGIGSNLPAGGSPISLDALEQVSVAVTPFDVRQSGFTGGAINAVTKSGTNEVKVSVYDYY